MNPTTIHWFRNDLRLHDNPALVRAGTDAQHLIPVFIIDPISFAPLPGIGIPKAGAHRMRFLLESLTDLRKNLRKKKSDLVIRVGNPVDVLAELAEKFGVKTITSGQEATTEELDLDEQVRKRLKTSGATLTLVNMLPLYHPDDLPFDDKHIPDAYRDFRKTCEKKAAVREEAPDPALPPLPPDLDSGDMPTMKQLGLEEPPVDDRAAIHFIGGETAALKRLDDYFWQRDQLRNYKYTRNGLLGEDYSSKFSAWLANGCLSPRRIYWQVKQYEQERKKNVSTYWLVFELIWRDYFRYEAIKYGKQIFLAEGPRKVDPKGWMKNKELFEKWAAGQTGIPFVDANMRELNATGFMSNRGRQNIASFLITRDGKPDLSVWWPWGAAYLESLLIDYDPASNWGNWNMVAKVGPDERNDRYFNIYTQATRYDPKGEYVKHWCPELTTVPAEHLHLLSTNSEAELKSWGVTLGKNYPEPLVDPLKWTRRSAAHAHDETDE